MQYFIQRNNVIHLVIGTFIDVTISYLCCISNDIYLFAVTSISQPVSGVKGKKSNQQQSDHLICEVGGSKNPGSELALVSAQFL